MKYAIASLIAGLSANEVNAQIGFLETKKAFCHYTEDMSDFNKPRMLFDLDQVGADDNPVRFKLKM